MVEKTKEFIATKKVYVANDGTEFNTSVECETYENTVLCSLRQRINKFLVNKISELELLGGSEEYIYSIYSPKTNDDYNNLLYYFNLLNSNLESPNAKLLINDINSGKTNLIFGSYENEDNFIFYWGTFDEFINNIKSKLSGNFSN